MRFWFALIMVVYILLNWLIARQLYHLLNINLVAFAPLFIILAATPLLSRVGHFGWLEAGQPAEQTQQQTQKLHVKIYLTNTTFQDMAATGDHEIGGLSLSRSIAIHPPARTAAALFTWAT